MPAAAEEVSASACDDNPDRLNMAQLYNEVKNLYVKCQKSYDFLT